MSRSSASVGGGVEAHSDATRDRDAYLDWLREWVLEVPDHAAYLRKVGSRFAALKPTRQRLAAAVDYA
jgi:hypothetical protein